MELQEFYIASQRSSAEARYVCAKLITTYNKQQVLNGNQLFDPLFYIKDNLNPYYQYLITKMEELNITYQQFCSNFNYRVRFDTAVYNILRSQSFYYFYLTNKDTLLLTFAGVPFRYCEANNRVYLTLNGVRYYFNSSDIFSTSLTLM